GGLVFSGEYEDLRSEAIAISKKVEALQDSLNARELQLAQMKRLMITGGDAASTADDRRGAPLNGGNSQSPEPGASSAVTEHSGALLVENELVSYDLFRR